MRTHPGDARCKNCSVLLARIEDSTLVIKRGDLQANISGDYRAELICYRCRGLNVLVPGAIPTN